MRIFSIAIIMALLFFGYACHPTGKIVQKELISYQLTDSIIYADSAIENLVKPFRDSIAIKMDEELIESKTTLEKGQPESKLGNFFSDACIEIAKNRISANDTLHFAFFNNGGLRASLPKGMITIKNIFELMPFENELVILKLSGSQTEKLINFIAQKGGVPVSQISMTIRDSKPEDVLINGKPFDPQKPYFVLTSDYLANGGDQLFFLTDALSRKNLSVKIRDGLIELLKAKSNSGLPVDPTLDNRIVNAK